MDSNFDKKLDECIDRNNRGESIEACLADYPEQAAELEPLLRAMLQTQGTYYFEPSVESRREARQRFNAAREELARKREARQPLFPWLSGLLRVGVPVALVAIVALAGYFGIRPALSPVTPGPQPSPEGNFVFLLSDEVNAIGDFDSLDVSISKIGLQLKGEDNRWIEFEPEVELADLTLLEGEKAQEIWRGDVPEGEYTKIFMYVSDVNGILTETGEEVDVKLPSNKLQMSKTFEVTTDSLTNFVYDLTVIAAGSPQSGIKYILQPQVGQSGADKTFEEISGKGKEKQQQNQGQNQDNNQGQPQGQDQDHNQSQPKDQPQGQPAVPQQGKGSKK